MICSVREHGSYTLDYWLLDIFWKNIEAALCSRKPHRWIFHKDLSDKNKWIYFLVEGFLRGLFLKRDQMTGFLRDWFFWLISSRHFLFWYKKYVWHWPQYQQPKQFPFHICPCCSQLHKSIWKDCRLPPSRSQSHSIQKVVPKRFLCNE